MYDLTPHERLRIEVILDAAKTDDWERFQALSDKPFSNAVSMREQLEESSAAIRGSKNCRLHVDLKHHDDGARHLFARIQLDTTAPPIILTLHSANAEAESAISIWTFFSEVDFS